MTFYLYLSMHSRSPSDRCIDCFFPIDPLLLKKKKPIPLGGGGGSILIRDGVAYQVHWNFYRH